MGAKQKRKSGQKPQDKSDSMIDSFSPIPLDSPSQPSQGNLTGSARKLKDGAADLNNYMEKWTGLNAEGSSIVSEIANIKLDTLLSNSENNAEQDLYPESLIPLCEKLDKLLTRMEKVVSRLSGLVEMSKGVAELEKFNQSEAGSSVLFQTWDVDKFSSVFSEICSMYKKEMTLKHCISENICHASDRNTIMFYSAAWIHQPHIDDTQAELLLESMLRETKHKT